MFNILKVALMAASVWSASRPRVRMILPLSFQVITVCTRASVRPPGGRTDALVQTVITWNDNGKILRTRGLDADQTEAAIKATFKMLNIFENEQVDVV